MEITQLLIFFADTEIFFSYADFSKDENDAQPYVILTRQMGERTKQAAGHLRFAFSSRSIWDGGEKPLSNQIDIGIYSLVTAPPCRVYAIEILP
jgi:hypothetical protein